MVSGELVVQLGISMQQWVRGGPLPPPTGAFIGTTVGENVCVDVGAKVVKLLIDVGAILNVGA